MKKYAFLTLIILLAVSINAAESSRIKDFVEAARSQIGKTLFYDSSYRTLSYPNGDFSIVRGVCTQEEDLLFEFQLTGHYRIDGIEAFNSDC